MINDGKIFVNDDKFHGLIAAIHNFVIRPFGSGNITIYPC